MGKQKLDWYKTKADDNKCTTLSQNRQVANGALAISLYNDQKKMEFRHELQTLLNHPMLQQFGSLKFCIERNLAKLNDGTHIHLGIMDRDINRWKRALSIAQKTGKVIDRGPFNHNNKRERKPIAAFLNDASLLPKKPPVKKIEE